MQLAGLTLEQAPPLSVPMRFFLTAPAFGVAAAAVWVVAGPEVLASRWSPALLVTVHLVTIGFATLVMMGAMSQMLPVVAGSPVPKPVASGAAAHLLVTVGTAVLAFAFLQAGRWPYLLAAGLLGSGIALFVVTAAIALARAPGGGESVVAMGLAVVALAVAAGLGAVLLLGHGAVTALRRVPLTDIHLAWGLVGWMGLLIVGVAYQVVPMFQLTPAYPGWARRSLAPWLLAWLVLLGLVPLLPAAGLSGPLSRVAEAGLGLGLAAFALVTLDRQRRRRRKRRDVTLSFWRFAMLLLLASVLLRFGFDGMAPGPAYPGLGQLPAVLFLMGFVVSVINGMLYKIVPFLVWFHLQGLATRRLQAGERPLAVPHMKQVIPDRWAWRQYHLHVVAMALLVAATAGPDGLRVAAGIGWAGSLAALWFNLWHAGRIYRRARAGSARAAQEAS